MGGFNPPVPQRDSNWEIRAAVLLSLFFQVLLIFLGPTRKRSSAPLFRLTVWSCYLLADWVADLALGLLLNNMGNIGGNNDNNATAGSSSSPVIFAFWTPFLLLHLGGPDTITAYSVEDNELWNRHLIGLLFEVISASVIVFCSIRNRNNPLVPATMLMLVAGVIKYGERTYSLYSGSNERLRDSIMESSPPEPDRNYSRLMAEYKSSRKNAGLPVELFVYDDDQEADRLELYSKSIEAQAYELFRLVRPLLVDVIISSKQRRLSQAFFLSDRPNNWVWDKHNNVMLPLRRLPLHILALDVMEVELNIMYDMVYTKVPIAHSMAGWVLRCICSGCLISALVIFFLLDKPRHQIQHVDAGITYALLLGGLALDAAALLMLFLSDHAKVYLDSSRYRLLRWLRSLRHAASRWQRQTRRRRWSGTVSQMNLFRYWQEKPGRPYSSNNGGKWWLIMTIVKMLGIEEIVDDSFFIQRVRLNKDGEAEERCGCLRRFFRQTLVPKCCRSEKDSMAESLLFKFIFRGIKDTLHKLKVEQEERKKAAAAQEQETKEPDEIEAEAEKDAIAEVCRRRGDGVIRSHKNRIKETTREHGHVYKVILDSVVSRDFDESLLLWHIATDLCLLREYQGPMLEEASRMRAIGETLSEYMVYLLIKQPDMLSATAGVGLRPYRDVCADYTEARRFFDLWLWQGIDKEDMRISLLSVDTSKSRPPWVKGHRRRSVLFDAVILAKALRELDEELMWDVITGVWREMLMFAAVSGRGRTHVRNLNRGGELITFVWLLMQHSGLSDMYEIQWDPTVRLIVHY